MPTPPPGFYFFVVVFWLVVVCTILMVLFKVAVWWGRRRTVNDYQEAAPVVMSRSADTAPVERPLSLQTDSRQTADRPLPPAPSRDVMLNTHKLLRKYGVPREEARPVLKALGLPLDNNLWTEAAPADDDTYATPIAGRPTSARFETDADYPYQKLA
jgi:hypothetical protein